jgi:ribosomal protein S18 acetylase RimI-like enzyme
VAESPGPGAEAGKARRCGKVKEARIIMIPASRKESAERQGISREIDHAIGEIRRRGGEVDPGLVRAKEAIGDEKNHLLVARSRWGELLGSLSYTFPDDASLRVDYIGLSVHRCGLGTRLMAAVAALALRGNRRIRLTAEADARGFFERLGMEKLEEYPDGNCSFGFTEEGMRRLVEKVRKIP